MKVKGWVDVLVKSSTGKVSSYKLTNSVTLDLAQWLMRRVKGLDYPDTGVPNTISVWTDTNVANSSTAFSERSAYVAQDRKSVTAYFTVEDMQFSSNQAMTINKVALYGANFYTLAETSNVNPNPQFASNDKVSVTYNIQFSFSNLDSGWVLRLVKTMVGLVDSAGSYVADNSKRCAINYGKVGYLSTGQPVLPSNTSFLMEAEAGGSSDATDAIAKSGDQIGMVFVAVASSVRPTLVYLYTREEDGNLVDVGNSSLNYDEGLTSWVTGDDLVVPYRFSITPDR